MAGTFPTPGGAERFREGIRYVFDMGAPPPDPDTLEEQRATFLFATELVYTGEGGVDVDGVPFDPEQTVQRVIPDPVTVPCGVRYFDSEGAEITNFGVVTPARVEISLLDEDYSKVREAVAVVIGGVKYVYQRMDAPSGLFDVGIYALHFEVESQS